MLHCLPLLFSHPLLSCNWATPPSIFIHVFFIIIFLRKHKYDRLPCHSGFLSGSLVVSQKQWNKTLLTIYIQWLVCVKKQTGFEASFDARAARTCAAIPFLELSLTVFFLVSFGVWLALFAPHDADLTRSRWTRVFCMLEGQGSLESFTVCDQILLKWEWVEHQRSMRVKLNTCESRWD